MQATDATGENATLMFDWQETGLIFADQLGGPTPARHVIDQFHEALAQAGLRRVRFHDLRHSCATLLLVQGVSPRVVMEATN